MGESGDDWIFCVIMSTGTEDIPLSIFSLLET